MAETVLITGATGLLGRAVAAQLEDNYQVIRSGRFIPKGARSGEHPQTWLQMDVSDQVSVDDALTRLKSACDSRLASVVHLAAYYDFSGEPSPLYRAVTVEGTRRLLAGLRDFEVGQFIFSSTMLVHAPSRFGHPITEDSPIDPAWDYPRSKVETESVIKAEHGTIPIVVLRIAGVYDEWCHSIPIAQQIRRIFERDVTSHLFPGDLHHGQAFVHLDDTVAAIVTSVERRMDLPAEATFLIGEPRTLSYGDLQDRIGHLTYGEEWATRQIPKVLAKVGAWLEGAVAIGPEPFIRPWMIDIADNPYCLDVSRARSFLGWQASRDLRSTLPAMVEHLLSDPREWYRQNDLDLRTMPRIAPHDVAAPAA